MVGSLGVSVKGAAWHRPDDTFGLSGVLSGASHEQIAFLKAGGTGILNGDGNLTYGCEKVLETYYDFPNRQNRPLHVGLPVRGRPGIQPRSRPGIGFRRAAALGRVDVPVFLRERPASEILSNLEIRDLRFDIWRSFTWTPQLQAMFFTAKAQSKPFRDRVCTVLASFSAFA